MINFALAGNPNCGKTTLFNSLTGSTAHVGNWPGVTVDKREGSYKKLSEEVNIIDLPGIYSLSPYTPEEIVARNFITTEKPDCVINVVDATNLERNLYLTTQIIEMDVPVVVALNMMDEINKNGHKMNREKLERHLGVPVIEVSALKGEGMEELMERAYEASKTKRVGTTVLDGGHLIHLIKDVAIALKNKGVASPLFHAIKLIEMDEVEVEMHAEEMTMVEEFKKTFNDEVFSNDFEALVADARYDYIAKNYSSALKLNVQNSNLTIKSERLDRVFTNKWLGIPIFLAVIFAVFHLTFSGNFLFLGGILGDGFLPLSGTAFEGVLGEGGLNSPGVILQSLMILASDSISAGVASLLVSAPAWVSGFIVDGVLAGLGGILSFVPQILLLFLFLSILEDSGYMSRVAFILDRLLRKFGVSGRAFLPMIMGFGCSVPAIMNTRTLADEKERLATIRVIPFFSCGAKLPILTGVSGAIAVMVGFNCADLITYSMYVLGMVVAMVTVIIMKKTSLKGEAPPFIMELPAYRRPQAKNTMLLLWDKLKHFIHKAFTIILLSSIIIWFVTHFSFSWKFLTDEDMANSILANLGSFIQPLFTPLGFGSQLKSWGWVFIVSAITGLVAKENVISTFSVLGAVVMASGGALLDPETVDEVSSVTAMIQATGITVPALIAFIAFNMTTIPCFAAVAATKSEISSSKTFKLTLLFWLVVSYVVSATIYLVGTYWYLIFVVLAIAIIGGILLMRGKSKEGN